MYDQPIRSIVNLTEDEIWEHPALKELWRDQRDHDPDYPLNIFRELCEIRRQLLDGMLGFAGRRSRQTIDEYIQEECAGGVDYC